MWGTKNKSTSISDFYQGDNIFSQLKNSLFGKIKQIFEQVFTDNTEKDYQLPKVIVIGTESSGKSSLLERITKCQLFPRDGKLCTKCPIKVKLQNGKSSYSVQLPDNQVQKLENKKDIYPIVQKYMNSLPNDFISENEIIINIVDNDMSNFEFYDLPGIRTYPEEIAELSVNICKKYLSDKNSIVLCVVPCTTTRLTSCQSIALIKETKMEHNTILALTMTDRLQPENIEELLINRIINKTDELNGIKFANCIAVVNRSHSDKHSLGDSDKTEKLWFEENIYSCIPEEYEIYKEQIIQKTSITYLLKNMDNLYNDFIHDDWIPRMLVEMHTRQDNIINDIGALGSIITEDNFETHIDNRSFNHFIKTTELLTFVNEHAIRFDISESAIKLKNRNEIVKLFNIDMKTIRDFISKDIELIFKNIMINYELESSIFDGPSKRFANLSKKCDKIFSDYSEKIFAKEIVELFKNHYINYSIGCISNASLKKDLLPYLESLFYMMFHDMSNNITDLDELTFEDFAESDEWTQKRLKLETERNDIKTNIERITILSQKLNLDNKLVIKSYSEKVQQLKHTNNLSLIDKSSDSDSDSESDSNYESESESNYESDSDDNSEIE